MIDYGSISQEDVYRGGEVIRKLKNYKIRVKVNGNQDLMTEFIRFTEELENLRGQLADRPSLVFEYPSENRDGSYFLIECYTVVEKM